MRRAVIAMLLAVGCSGSRGSAGWQTKIEATVEAICLCSDVACVDRESKGWDGLPWPDLRGASRETHERSIGLSRRGSRCQLAKRAQTEIDQLVVWAEQTCACSDLACANAIDDEVVAWLKKQEHEVVTGPILALARDAVFQHDRCYARLAGAPGAPGLTSLPDGVVQRVVAAADLVCACATMVCADLVDRELVDWLGLQYWSAGTAPPTSAVFESPAKEANARLQKCHAARSAKWPHESWMHGSYRAEP